MISCIKFYLLGGWLEDEKIRWIFEKKYFYLWSSNVGDREG